MDDDAMDKTYFDGQFIMETPVMTSNISPSPYTVYSNSIYSSTYTAYNAFSDKGDTSRWTSLNNSFDSNGDAIGDYPYLLLNLGNTVNRKRYCKMELSIVTGFSAKYLPNTITLGYSNDDINYTYYPIITDLTPTKWIDNDYTLTFHFEAPVESQQYWKLSILKNNGAPYTNLKRIKYFTDINNP